MKYDKDSDIQSYYRIRLHRLNCPVCSFPLEMRKYINIKLFKGVCSFTELGNYIIKKHPLYDDKQYDLVEILQKHKMYNEFLLEDIKHKSIFNRVKYLMKDKEYLEELAPHDKSRLVTQIEKELLIEYYDYKDEKLSLLKAITTNTLPLLVNRINTELKIGTARAIKELTNSLSLTIDTIKELENDKNKLKSKDSKDNKNNENEDDSGMELLDIDSSRKEKIISLSDKIQQAMGTRD